MKTFQSPRSGKFVSDAQFLLDEQAAHYVSIP